MGCPELSGPTQGDFCPGEVPPDFITNILATTGSDTVLLIGLIVAAALLALGGAIAWLRR